MGPQFTRSRSGELRVTDWNFNYWGNEEPDSANSIFDEPFDRIAACVVRVPVLDAAAGPVTGVRMIHEGGGVTHNGKGTMIAVESVVMQRNLGPNRFCGGKAPATDYDQPNTYAPNPDWLACKALVENEYRRMLGVKKVIWVPTGVIEDNGTFRGALAPHIHVPRLKDVDIPHSGVYTLFTTNGHIDEFLRFVAPDTVLLAQEAAPKTPPNTPVDKLLHWLQEQNIKRLERVRDILSNETTESGEPIRILRIPAPVLTLEVFVPGDGTYDYLKEAFPGRRIAQVYSENVNRGGGGMNCITQQQPASARFARKCGWAKVKVGVQAATLYAKATGEAESGSVTRLT